MKVYKTVIDMNGKISFIRAWDFDILPPKVGMRSNQFTHYEIPESHLFQVLITHSKKVTDYDIRI